MSPRDGSGIFSQPDPDVVADTTIESAKYNNFTNDVAQDLNLPRPIVAGGTGAVNAHDAMINLQGSLAYQVVTNYDSHLFVSGAFYSLAGATNSPTANAFTGICYTSDPAVVAPALPANANMFIEARDQTTAINYIRKKAASVWGAWVQQSGSVSDLDAAYVNVIGDTMTGLLVLPVTVPTLGQHATNKTYVDASDALKVSKAGDTMSGNLVINKFGVDTQFAMNTSPGFSNDIIGQKNGNARWFVRLGNETAEGGANAGSDFYITRFVDAGTFLGNPLTISRASGTTSISTGTDAGLSLQVGGTDVAPRIQMWGDRGAGIGSNIHFNTGNGAAITTNTSVAIRLGGGALNVMQSSGVTVGVPTGGDKGLGSINAVSVYDDNVLLTCAGIEYAKHGSVDLGKWNAVSPTGEHKLARQFVEMLKDFDPRDPAQYIQKMLHDEALPGMPNSKNWQHNELSTGEMITRLWLAVEMLATAFSTVYKNTEKARERGEELEAR